MSRLIFLLGALWGSGALAQQPDLRMPYSEGERWILTRAFGVETHRNHDHFAMDFTLAGCGSWREPALAAAQGTVQFAGVGDWTYGNQVVVDHGGGYTTRYAHLDQISVSAGDFVNQGDQVGLVGNSGNVEGVSCREHPGTHLHFSLNLNGRSVQPESMSRHNRWVNGWTYYSDNTPGCTERLPGDWSYCSNRCKCSSGEGDCDRDSHCAPGLRCVDDIGGNFGFSRSLDICLPNGPIRGAEPAACHLGRPNGHWSFCSVGCKCRVGQGDCDRNSHCAAGLICRHNVGHRYGMARSVDVCEVP